MHHFIESLLEAHSRTLAEQWDMTIRLPLDTEAQCSYEQIERQVVQRCRNKQNPEEARQRWRVQLLAVSFTHALAAISLEDSKIYDTLVQAAERWCPWQVEVQPFGRLMQQVLLSVLPDARRKQELIALCSDYKEHLSKEIDSQLSSAYPQVHTNYQKAESRLFGAPPFENGEKRALSIDSECQLLERFVAEKASKLSQPSRALTGAIQKYQAVSTLESALKTPIKPAAVQLADFRQAFLTQQAVIIQDRDSWAIKFAKGVATFFSLGLAAFLGIWSVKGQTAANEMTRVLSTAALASTHG